MKPSSTKPSSDTSPQSGKQIKTNAAIVKGAWVRGGYHIVIKYK